MSAPVPAAPAGPAPGDPFGDAYRAVLAAGGRPGAAHLVYELADGYVYAEDAAFYLSGPEAWWPVDREAYLRCSGRVLDVGCGAGRQAVHLAARGCEVVGVDPSPGAVAAARARGVRALPGSLPELELDEPPFDSFLLAGANLGLLGGAEGTRAALRRLAGLARPGARILGTTMIVPGGTTRMRVRYGAAASEWSDFHFLPPDGIAAAAAEAGWRLADVVHDPATPWPTYLAELRLEGEA
ncbi:methyltransferase domain-containing protein [Nocardiopsis sp. CNT-189]|uniref:class I SAM-dependent methyltransferase n=1 Tax=Nocardiopsis oceanisediminis TaxID=2816862 RepID=UPI003B385106